ncbi:chromate transporter [Flavobacterium cyanobacteriorum]|uniref:Chromate transporter n=1 Tax=Flavobacterium cyanobacteriorum TaxID=2022802 RepID=A0A255ZA41_9FLAO|nr:chromate efflux transporter [Flavobacterium cyanobacteriorum]OYQ37764.1 chromate transporter [Flavobacterium cyanobacteriorum]
MAGDLMAVIRLFARLGITAFGGPAAHIAMMRREVVERRQWMQDNEFLDLVGATGLIPGPNSTEMAIHLGHKKAGWKGLIAAGVLFILPAVIITGFIAWLYKHYGALPVVEPFIYGIKPAIIAIIVIAVYPMARASLKNMPLVLLGAAALAMALAGIPELFVMLGMGLLYMVYSGFGRRSMISFLPLTGAASVSNTGLFFTFLKIGSVLYGSGYALFAFIDNELVATGVLQSQVLIDAIAVGQFTPGPVFSSVTFIGYQVNGLGGAVVSTIGVFLPSFIFVALLGTILKYLEGNKAFRHFLDAVNVASVAIIMAVCWQMGKECIINWQTTVIAVSALFLLIAFPKINSALIVLSGSLAGYLLAVLH